MIGHIERVEERIHERIDLAVVGGVGIVARQQEAAVAERAANRTVILTGDTAPERIVEVTASGFKIADGEPDIRGWEVRTLAGMEVGEVDDLLIDPNLALLAPQAAAKGVALTIRPSRPGLAVRASQPGLEDVFIHLMRGLS